MLLIKARKYPFYELRNIKVKKYGFLSSKVQAHCLSLRKGTTCWQLLSLGICGAILDNLRVMSILKA